MVKINELNNAVVTGPLDICTEFQAISMLVLEDLFCCKTPNYDFAYRNGVVSSAENQKLIVLKI